MSVAIINNDGVDVSPSTFVWTKRSVSTLAANQNTIVKNFNIADDTFDLETGTYRIDVTAMAGVNNTIGVNLSRTAISPATPIVIFNESTGARVEPGIATRNVYNESAFSPGYYFVGTASAISATNDTITFNNHLLGAGDQVSFFGSIPGGLVSGDLYNVTTAGLTANVFKVSSGGAGGTAINLTGTNTPAIYARPLTTGVLTDARAQVARYRVEVPAGSVYTFSIRRSSSNPSPLGDGLAHGVTTTLGGAAVPSRYMTIKITKTD